MDEEGAASEDGDRTRKKEMGDFRGQKKRWGHEDGLGDLGRVRAEDSRG